MHSDIKKVLLAIIITTFTGAIVASAKSIIDVERLKVQYTGLFDIVKGIEEDVKYIRNNMKP